MLAQPPSRPATGLPRERALERLLEHIQALMHVDAAAFVLVDRERHRIDPVAGWFSSPDLRDAIEGSPGLAQLVVERDRSLLLPRVEAWEAAPDLLAATMDSLGEARATRVWAAYRAASVIACPVKNAAGQALGVLLVASGDPAQPLRANELRMVEVLADLSALALERSELLEAEGRRSQEERWLKRAAEEISGSLELDEVYRRIVDHAARVTGATKAVLTRVDGRGGVLRTAASLDVKADTVPERPRPDRAVLGDVARQRRPSRTE